MNAASSASDEGLTSEQIAEVGVGPTSDPPGPQARLQPGAKAAEPVQRLADGAHPSGTDGPADGRNENEPRPAGADTASAGQKSSLAGGAGPSARLLEGADLQRMVIRWKEIQAHFVDEPRTAVEQADALVAGLMQQLAAMFARERAELEQRWAGGGNEVSTEDLRQSLRRYRSFFERLLAA